MGSRSFTGELSFDRDIHAPRPLHPAVSNNKGLPRYYMTSLMAIVESWGRQLYR